MMVLFEDLVAIAQNSREPKDYEAAGKQGARCYEVLNVTVIEKSVVADRLEEAEKKLHGQKKSRRSMRARDVEAALAEPPPAGEVRH